MTERNGTEKGTKGKGKERKRNWEGNEKRT